MTNSYYYELNNRPIDNNYNNYNNRNNNVQNSVSPARMSYDKIQTYIYIYI